MESAWKFSPSGILHVHFCQDLKVLPMKMEFWSSQIWEKRIIRSMLCWIQEPSVHTHDASMWKSVSYQPEHKRHTTLDKKKKNHHRDSRREERCSTCDIMLDQAWSAQGKFDPRLSATFALPWSRLIEHDITRGTAFFSPRIARMVLLFVQGGRILHYETVGIFLWQTQWIWWKVFSPKLDNIQECLVELSSFSANYQLPFLKRWCLLKCMHCRHERIIRLCNHYW